MKRGGGEIYDLKKIKYITPVISVKEYISLNKVYRDTKTTPAQVMKETTGLFNFQITGLFFLRGSVS